MIEIGIGMLAAISGVAFFYFGYRFGRSFASEKEESVVEEPVKDIPPEAMKEREMIEADRRAFRTLMDYSADMAYGVVKAKEQEW